MALSMDQIRFETELPKLPATAPLVRVAAPDYERRERGMAALGEALGLGKLREAFTDFGRAMAGPRGEVEFFRASGAVWSADIAAAQEHDSELRDWPELEEAKTPEGPRLTLAGRQAEMARDLAASMAERGGFDLEHAGRPRLDLVQVAELDEKGQERRRGAGEATMVWDYALDGLPLIGAGAKTLVDMVPDGREGLRPTGAVTVWRTPVGTGKLAIGGTEAVLDAGLLRDPDLTLAAKAGGQVVVETLRLGLLALPAAMVQDLLFPVIEVSGRVELKDAKAPHYNFGRICPAAPAKAYAEAGLAPAYIDGLH